MYSTLLIKFVHRGNNVLLYCFFHSWSLQPFSLEVTASLIQQQEYEKLVDFDNHLDNIALDWRNKDINTTIDELIREEEMH